MVAAVKAYRAEVTRDGKFWHIRIPEFDRSTQALRYRDVEVMASELIEIMTGLGSQDYDLNITVHLPSSVADHLIARGRRRCVKRPSERPPKPRRNPARPSRN